MDGITILLPRDDGQDDSKITGLKGCNPLWIAWWLGPPSKTRDAWQPRWFEVEVA